MFSFFFDKKKQNILNLQLKGLGAGRGLIIERDSFLYHEGGLNSHHTKAMLKWGSLKNPSQHIDRVMNAQSSQQILQNRF